MVQRSGLPYADDSVTKCKESVGLARIAWLRSADLWGGEGLFRLAGLEGLLVAGGNWKTAPKSKKDAFRANSLMEVGVVSLVIGGTDDSWRI
jgi:hypothetical protein